MLWWGNSSPGFSQLVLQIWLQSWLKDLTSKKKIDVWKQFSCFSVWKWSRPVASCCCWWWCAVYYLWVRLFAPKSVSSRTINFRNRPNSRMQMLPGGRTGKKHSQYCNIQYIAHPTNAHCPLKLLGFFTYHLHAVQQQPDRYTCCCCASASCFLDAGGVFAFELGIGAIAAASALTRLMNRDRSLPGRQEAIAQNLITKGTALHKNFQFFNQSNMNWIFPSWRVCE